MANYYKKLGQEPMTKTECTYLDGIIISLLIERDPSQKFMKNVKSMQIDSASLVKMFGRKIINRKNIKIWFNEWYGIITDENKCTLKEYIITKASELKKKL